MPIKDTTLLTCATKETDWPMRKRQNCIVGMDSCFHV
jgi:hypothetical protein